MLCQFIVKNFKSYRDETILDFQAENIDEHAESLLYFEKDKKAFLPVSVLYGPNGGGKSGILEAFNCLIFRVVWPIYLMSNVHINSPKISKFTKYTPFAFNEISPNEPTEFTVFFRCSSFEFRYALSLYEENVLAESLYKRKIGGTKSTMIFERNENSITLGASIRKSSINANINTKMPYLSFLVINYDIETIKQVEQWFTIYWLCSIWQVLPDFFLDQVLFSSDSIKTVLDKQIFLKIVAEIDIPIDDYYIETNRMNKGNEKSSENEVYIIRKKDGKEYRLNLREESQGTRKLFQLLPIALFALKTGGLLVIDEMDASLHPKLLRYIVKLFKNKKVNTDNAQLLFTSHDVTTMKSDLFRRDEIWFAAKNDEGASEIYSLYEIRNPDGTHVRANAPFDKQYMEGRYGADPYLTNILSEEWGGEP